jgi:hypothetical protein
VQRARFSTGEISLSLSKNDAIAVPFRHICSKIQTVLYFNSLTELMLHAETMNSPKTLIFMGLIQYIVGKTGGILFAGSGFEQLNT